MAVGAEADVFDEVAAADEERVAQLRGGGGGSSLGRSGGVRRDGEREPEGAQGAEGLAGIHGRGRNRPGQRADRCGRNSGEPARANGTKGVALHASERKSRGAAEGQAGTMSSSCSKQPTISETAAAQRGIG